jgi:hypothetical protein
MRHKKDPVMQCNLAPSNLKDPIDVTMGNRGIPAGANPLDATVTGRPTNW